MSHDSVYDFSAFKGVLIAKLDRIGDLLYSIDQSLKQTNRKLDDVEDAVIILQEDTNE